MSSTGFATGLLLRCEEDEAPVARLSEVYSFCMMHLSG